MTESRDVSEDLRCSPADSGSGAPFPFPSDHSLSHDQPSPRAGTMPLTLAVFHSTRRLGCLILCCALLSACVTDTLTTSPAALNAQIQQRLEHTGQQHTGPQLVVGGMTIAQGVAEFYQRRDFAPVWNDNTRIDQLIEALADLRLDGLNPADYQLDQLRSQRQQFGKLNPGQQVDFELTATHAYLLALVHLYQGKIDPNRLDSRWNFDAHALDLQQGMQVAIDAVANSNIAAAFERARPQQRIYPQLRAALQQLYRVEASGGWPQVPDGPTLKPGLHDARVPLLRQRLLAAGLPVPGADHHAADDGTDTLFDTQLSTAVSQFQREQYLEVDGNVGAATLAALNVTVQARIAQLRANLERSRWLLHEIHGDFVLVDIAGYRVHFYRDGVSVWNSRVQVGKPYRSTPVFKSRVTHITVNPTWTVPPTIYRNDILPKLKTDPGYLAKNRLRVLDNKGNELNAASINWDQPGNILLRQDAGAGAALGQVAIRFPNSYAVYLHDTPNQRMFDQRQRAFSSGCIRVERPLELVERLFEGDARWSRPAIDAAIASGETRNITLQRQLPILLMYWTVDLHATKSDATVRVAFKPDIYQHDQELIRALDNTRAGSGV